MTQERKNELRKLAKGHWQKEILSDLLTGREIVNPVRFLQGKAFRYLGHYQKSFANLLSRLNSAGVTVKRIPGPRGGEYSATYKIIF